MDTMFFEYVEASDTEKKIMLESAEADLKLDKLFAAFEMVEMNLALNYEAADLKVMQESGTYDDLNTLYEEANAEADGKKKGILASIINGIISICQSIRNAIAGIFKKNGGDEDIVQAPEGYEKDASAIKGYWNRIRTGFQKIKSGDLKGIGDIIAGAAVPTLVTVGAAGAVAVTYKTVKKSQLKKTSDEIEQISNEMENDLKSVQGIVNAAGAVTAGTDNEKISKFKEFLNCISNFIKKCRAFIMGLFKKGGESSGDSSSEKTTNLDKVGNNRPKNPGASDKNDASSIRKNIAEIKKALSKETDESKKSEYEQRLTVLNNNLASLISKNPALVSRKEKKNSAKADAVKKTISKLQEELGKAKTPEERVKIQDKIKNAQSMLSNYTKECGIEIEIAMAESFSFVEFFESAERIGVKNVTEPVFEFGDFFDEFEDCFYESEEETEEESITESTITIDELADELDEIQRSLGE